MSEGQQGAEDVTPPRKRERFLSVSEVEEIVHELALFAFAVKLVQSSATPPDDPRREGCRYATGVAAHRLNVYDPKETLQSLFMEGLATLQRLDPAGFVAAVRDSATKALPVFGAPVPSGQGGGANQAAVRELLNVRWFLDHAANDPKLSEEVRASIASGLAYATAFIDARIRLRDPDGSVERRIRASVSTPKSRDILKRDER